MHEQPAKRRSLTHDACIGKTVIFSIIYLVKQSLLSKLEKKPKYMKYMK